LVSVILAAAATTYSIQKTEAILGADVWRSGKAPIAIRKRADPMYVQINIQPREGLLFIHRNDISAANKRVSLIGR
jgi:hypothetical protein